MTLSVEMSFQTHHQSLVCERQNRQLDFVTIKIICSTKDSVKTIRHTTGWRKHAKDTSGKGLLCKPYKNP